MLHEKKLEFLHKIAKLGLDHIQHYDGGGVISAGNAGPLGGIAGALTVQNPYQAASPTSAGTVGAQQAGLAGQLQGEAAGGGPNPAQLQFIQNAQNLAQQQAATNASNRALNPGLAARMSSQAAVAQGQQAASGAAQQQMQQQLAAQQQLQGLTGQEQQGVLGAEQINAQVQEANAQAAQQTMGGIFGGVGAALGLSEGGEVKEKKMAKGGQAPDSRAADPRTTMSAYDEGGPVSGVGSRPIAGYADGGELPLGNFNIHSMAAPTQAGTSFGSVVGKGIKKAMAPSKPAQASPGATPTAANNFGAAPLTMPGQGSSAGVGMARQPGLMGPTPVSTAPSLMAPARPVANQEFIPPEPAFAGGGEVMPKSHVGKFLAAAMSRGGKLHKPVKAMVSPGEISLSPDAAKAVADGKANPFKVGEKIKGKPKVKGDSEENDTVPKNLEEGGVIIKRTIAMKMDPKKAREFVAKSLSKKRFS